MSKKRRQKIQKILDDKTLSLSEKESLIEQIKDDGLNNKRVKKS